MKNIIFAKVINFAVGEGDKLQKSYICTLIQI